MQWIQNEYGTYLVPAKKSNRINSFRRWEQAFRIYATIYCGENPNRSREIWQYISVINTAASTYIWDNVYNYDIIFRQLMEFNPARSWAVTYTQMWNLSMKQTLSNTAPNYGKSVNTGSGMLIQNGNGKSGRRIKNDYCWSFNRGERCKFGKNCRYKERCSYCDSPTHGINSCYKLEKRDTYGQNNYGNHQNNAVSGMINNQTQQQPRSNNQQAQYQVVQKKVNTVPTTVNNTQKPANNGQK